MNQSGLLLDLSNNGVERISLAEAKLFVLRWHYSKIFPPHCLVNLGMRDEKGQLRAVAMWGYGVRPKHTIKRLFPSLDVQDYFELNRLCLTDYEPRNTESHFLSLCVDWIKKNHPERKLLFSWADGLRGKPGFVYQAASWLYGGFIKTDLYLDENGGPVHPRLMITRLGTRGKDTWKQLGLTKWYGYQFRYVKFLCGHAERKRLLRESPFEWNQNYPKLKDCRWWVDRGDGIVEVFNPPEISGVGKIRGDKYKKNKAGEGSRESRRDSSSEGMGQFHHPAPDYRNGILFEYSGDRKSVGEGGG